MFKKIISTILCILLISLSTVAFAKETVSKEMDILDILIAAGTYLNSEIATEECISEDTYLEKVVPLFNDMGEVVAYYATFSPTGYAVVNNNVENPTVIEFGEGNNKTIEDILKEKSDYHIIYNNPIEIYETSRVNFSDKNKTPNGLYDYYPELKEIDYDLAYQHDEYKQQLLEKFKMARGDGDYGFINLKDMPSGSYTAKTILSATSTDWTIMDSYNDIAKNHCGATTVTNLALYFAKRGNTNLKINTKRDTFKAVHKIIGNGPSMTIASGAKQYFKDRGYTLNYKSVSNFNGIKSATTDNHPCGILLADGLFAWHWIISVGYREYNSGGNYMRIMDNWFNTVDRYYKIGTGSLWWSATEYWVN
ncbi:hypothetical protein EDD65_104172 [Keratinibaculum paraultunense]|uniref:Peptidase C39-like protein n=1 Tax=Keratinibaculum paraultunense TaxID=1278232 RepID=A0A4R3KXQ2_9FIRM|nr:hypothetical protein [Keratinibaculum paraultunense]QQY79006.1 hypothetical protein JL105_07360 [Keratinibaculum paraultunense]TCS90629.1 hypothetical protein EDD65_104172 [Keratinibaculum paraultunense]